MVHETTLALEPIVGESASLECGVVITDRAGNVLWSNEAFRRMTGYTIEEMQGWNPGLRPFGEPTGAACASLWRTALAGETWRGNVRNRTKNGEKFQVRITVTPLCEAGERMTHMVAVHEPGDDQARHGASMRALGRAIEDWRLSRATAPPG